MAAHSCAWLRTAAHSGAWLRLSALLLRGLAQSAFV
jgi:hypothetical protein